MKAFLNISFLLCFSLGCSQSDTSTHRHPLDITEKELKGYYDIAKFEVYKITSTSVCDCQGVIAYSDFKKDTFSLLELDANMININVSQDTITVFFDFFHKNIRAYVIPQGYTDCHDTIGVVFCEGAVNPKFALLGEALVELSEWKWDSIRTNNLLSCIASGQKVNHWLLEYIEAHDIKPY